MLSANPTLPALHRLEHHGRSTAALRLEGTGPTLVWLCGYGSDMNSAKASWLTEQCQIWGFSLVKFDFTGNGQSAGNFASVTLTHWVEDALTVIDNLTDGPVILIGSSMGGWVAQLAALQRPDRVKALLLIAPATDMARKFWEEDLDDTGRAEAATTGMLPLNRPIPISYTFAQDALGHCIMQDYISITCPVSILHGMEDDIIDWRRSLTLAEKLVSDKVTVELIKDAGHMLGRDQDLVMLWQIINRLREAA